MTKPTIPQLYIIELESPPEINELITTVYNTSINPLLYQLIITKTINACTLLINL